MNAKLADPHECVIYGDRCLAGGIEQRLDLDALFKRVEEEFIRYLIDYGVVLASHADIYDIASAAVGESCKCSRLRGLDVLLRGHAIPRLQLYLVHRGGDPDDILYLHLPRYLTERVSKKVGAGGEAVLCKVLARVRFVVNTWMRHVAGSDDLELFGGSVKTVARVKWGLLEELVAAVIYDAYSLASETYERTPKDWYFGVLAEFNKADGVREFLRPDGAYTAFKFGGAWVLRRRYECNSALGYCYSYRRIEAEDPELEEWP